MSLVVLQPGGIAGQEAAIGDLPLRAERGKVLLACGGEGGDTIANQPDDPGGDAALDQILPGGGADGDDDVSEEAVDETIQW